MKHWPTIFLILFLCTTPSVHAQEEPEAAPENVGIYIELGAGNDPDVMGGEIGMFGYTSDHLSLRGGIAFLASERFDDVFSGASAGFRLNLFAPKARVSPFIGMGIFAGYTKEEEPAEDDGLDNDDDGTIDESGEKKEIIENVIGTIYPEAGLHIWVSPSSRLTFSNKYNFTSEGRENDFWIYNIGFAFKF
ncbi:MAG: hypothetical protein KKD44_24590 [Proteobacteria bacterium]|nr:hypothetical protein [Pseudomonadota bacterium]